MTHAVTQNTASLNVEDGAPVQIYPSAVLGALTCFLNELVVFNAGTIGIDDKPLYAVTGAVITNVGAILGTDYCVFLGDGSIIDEADSNYQIKNSGTIDLTSVDNRGRPVDTFGAIEIDVGNGDNTAEISNSTSGSITGPVGISSGALTLTVTNAGLIGGDTIGIQTTEQGSTNVISNAGTIQGATDAVAARGSVTLRNTGSLFGDVVLGDGGSIFSNTGTVAGNIALGNGTNVFKGRGGTVDGTITGGSGTDRIIAGDDGETLAGGAGHDRLYGGAGDDTFAFSSFKAADTDTVKDLNVADDTIQLDHTVFTHLAADHVPSFAVGIKASGPTDFLFYNTSTGQLFYDVDGNGTAHAPYEVADLGKGLHLTAANFDVI